MSAAIQFEFDPKTHIFTQGGQRKPSVTQVLAHGGLCDYSFLDEEIREYSMARGTSVHWLTQLEDEGALDYRRVPKSLRGYRKAWNTWKERSGFQTLRIEYQFVSEYGFAGIIDRIGTLPHGGGRMMAVVDLKTGPITHHVRYQLAPYTVAAAEGRPMVAHFYRRIALRLKPDETYQVKEFPISDWWSDWARFMKALRGMNGNGNIG
jgi:DNA-binding transcriptional ArsR family regulator